MPTYRVFGGTLESPILFPELRLAPSNLRVPVSWTLELSAGSRADRDTRLGTQELVPGIHATLGRLEDGGYRLSLDDTGVFTVSQDGTRITWEAKEHADQEIARLDVLGRALAVACHARGFLCLHASAVTIGKGGVGFLAPKGFGKTTTALALVSRGARLLTDDTLLVDPVSGYAYPGVHAARLVDDNVGRFGSLGSTRPTLSEKSVLEQLDDSRVAEEPAPLLALYVLEPVDPEVHVVPSRVRLPDPAAVISLVQYAKLGSLLGGVAAVEVFDRSSRLVSGAPVYALRVPRDTARLDDVAAAVDGWSRADEHAGPAAGA